MVRATASRLFFRLVLVALACTPSSLFAQRGGGSHGGGGGFRGGGGFTGGGGRTVGGRSSGGSYRPAPSAPRYSGGSSYARPGGNSYRPSARNSRSAYAGGGRVAGVTQAIRDGQWHSFGAQGSAPRTAGTSFAASPLRVATPAGAVNAGMATRSFVGQGSEVYETTSRGAASITALRLSPLHLGRSRIFGMRALGLGLGFGWDSCWGVGWALDPFCFNTIGAWPPYGYDGYVGYLYPDSYDDLYPPPVGYGPNYDDSSSPHNTPPDSSSWGPAALVNPNIDTSANAGQLILVRRDGQILQAVAFTTSGDRLTYITSNGIRRSFPIVELDKDATRQMNDAGGTTVALPD